MTRLILAAILGGLAAFIWGFVSWVVLPWHNMTMDNLPDSDQFRADFRDRIPQSGVYLFPGMPPTEDEAAMKEFEEKYAEGSTGMLFYTKEGLKSMDAMVMFRGFVIAAVCALFGAGLLSWSVPVIGGYWRRVWFVTLIGAAAVFSTHLIEWNYWHRPSGYTFVNAVDLVLFWMVIGLVVAALVRPGTAEEIRGEESA